MIVGKPFGYKDAWVVAAVKGRFILSYYQGEGEWGLEEHARICRSDEEIDTMKADARHFLPPKATDVVAVGTYVRQG